MLSNVISPKRPGPSPTTVMLPTPFIYAYLLSYHKIEKDF